MKLKDQLTAFRIILAPIVMGLIFAGKLFPAFVIYLVAAITDILDGYFARKSKASSENGEIFDALADFTLAYLTVFAIAITRKWVWLTALMVVSIAIIIYALGTLSMKKKKLSIPHRTSAKIFAVCAHPAIMAYIINWEHAGILFIATLVSGLIAGIDYIAYAMKHKTKK